VGWQGWQGRGLRSRDRTGGACCGSWHLRARGSLAGLALVVRVVGRDVVGPHLRRARARAAARAMGRAMWDAPLVECSRETMVGVGTRRQGSGWACGARLVSPSRALPHTPPPPTRRRLEVTWLRRTRSNGWISRARFATARLVLARSSGWISRVADAHWGPADGPVFFGNGCFIGGLNTRSPRLGRVALLPILPLHRFLMSSATRSPSRLRQSRHTPHTHTHARRHTPGRQTGRQADRQTCPCTPTRAPEGKGVLSCLV
jgi:hypothetical protein